MRSPPQAATLIDIGSGAGFPGVALKIARPDLTITLVEAVGKKAEFLHHIITLLKLAGITVIQSRAEDLAHDQNYRQHYDIATARAVAKLSVLAEYVLPFLKVSGIFIAMKQTGTGELADARNALAILGGSHAKIIPTNNNHELIVIEKVKDTLDEYPRRAGMPAKRPL